MMRKEDWQEGITTQHKGELTLKHLNALKKNYHKIIRYLTI